jgi:hypothetical protein
VSDDELRDDADVRGAVLQALTLDAAVNAAWAAPGVRTVDDAIVVDY